MDYLLLLAPTNAVALSVGGKTIDAGCFNRWRPAEPPCCHSEIKLAVVVVDKFSMVSLSWLWQTNEALQTALRCKNKPFGGVPIVWIGDVHQLPPVMGWPLYSPAEQLTELWDQLDRALLTGASFQNCHPLAVLTWHQY
jgi:ATP-dependent DNA helicase PIF1